MEYRPWGAYTCMMIRNEIRQGPGSASHGVAGSQRNPMRTQTPIINKTKLDASHLMIPKDIYVDAEESDPHTYLTSTRYCS